MKILYICIVKSKPRNNAILSMIYAIDNGRDVKNISDTKDNIKNLCVIEWVRYISEYHHEKNRSQIARVNFGHYSEWFTPDILSTNFMWEKI